MFGEFFNLETMDGLDRAIYVSGGLAYLLLIWRCIVGLDLMQPRDGLSPAGLPTFAAFTLWLLLWGGDGLWPVRATFYLVNGAATDPVEVVAGDEILCLPPRSYAVASWRLDVPGDVMARGRGGEERHFRTGPGIWVVNAANATVSADFFQGPAASDNGGPASVSLQRPDSLHITLSGGKIYRMYSALPLDRLEASDSLILARHWSGRCREGRSGR